MRLIELAEIGMPHRFWYEEASQAIQEYANSWGWDWYRFADIIALTSPRRHIKTNIKMSIDYLITGKCKAVRSVQASLKYYEKTKTIRGLKTSEFARALKRYEDAIVLDTHMAKIFRVEHRKLETKVVYSKLANKIIRISKRLAIPPAHTQAALWCAYYSRKFPNREIPTIPKILGEMP